MISMLLIVPILIFGLAVSGGPERHFGNSYGKKVGVAVVKTMKPPKPKIVVKRVGNFCKVTKGLGGYILLSDAEMKALAKEPLARITAENEYGDKNCPEWKK
jgi:hypothetical protein